MSRVTRSLMWYRTVPNTPFSSHSTNPLEIGKLASVESNDHSRGVPAGYGCMWYVVCGILVLLVNYARKRPGHLPPPLLIFCSLLYFYFLVHIIFSIFLHSYPWSCQYSFVSVFLSFFFFLFIHSWIHSTTRSTPAGLVSSSRELSFLTWQTPDWKIPYPD